MVSGATPWARTKPSGPPQPSFKSDRARSIALGWAFEQVQRTALVAGTLPQPLPENADDLVGQDVVGHDLLIVHAQQSENDGRQNARPVLARGAVNDGGQGLVLGQQVEGLGDPMPGVGDNPGCISR